MRHTICVAVLGDVKFKKFRESAQQRPFEPIRVRRLEFQKDIPAIYDMLRRGCEEACAVAADTLADVRRAMKINYFDDEALIAEQAQRFAQDNNLASASARF